MQQQDRLIEQVFVKPDFQLDQAVLFAKAFNAFLYYAAIILLFHFYCDFIKVFSIQKLFKHFLFLFSREEKYLFISALGIFSFFNLKIASKFLTSISLIKKSLNNVPSFGSLFAKSRISL